MSPMSFCRQRLRQDIRSPYHPLGKRGQLQITTGAQGTRGQVQITTGAQGTCGPITNNNRRPRNTRPSTNNNRGYKY